MKLPAASYVDPRLALARQSPYEVEHHNKQRWLDLFTNDAFVEDPVGSGQHHSHSNISRFYDTFIAPNQVVFEPQLDVVCGQTVARDVLIHTTTKSHAHITTHAHLRYQITDSEPLRISSMRANWELRQNVATFMRQGIKGIQTSVGTSWGILTNLGPKAAFHYSKGLLCGVFDGGKKRTQELMEAIKREDSEALSNITLLVGDEPMSPQAFFSWTGPIQRAVLYDCLASGYEVSSCFEIIGASHGLSGIAFVSFDPKTKCAMSLQLLTHLPSEDARSQQAP